MEITSPRARRELQKLLSGEKLSIGKCEVSLPADALAIHVLAQLLQRYRVGPDGAVSEADAEAFLTAVMHEAEVGQGPTASAPSEPDQAGDDADRPKWRLHRLRARNYRGLTEWGGCEFEHDFRGLPHHIYGPNGSGKTAILSAIVWCLTGSSLRDRDEPQTHIRSVDLYADETCVKCLEGGWPEVVTVPHNLSPSELAQVRPSCSVEIELRSGDRRVTVERSLDGRDSPPVLRVREGDASYESLAQLGVSETDCELTMLMPGRVNALRFAPGSKFSDNLLSVSGLDALCDLAEFAARFGRSVRKRANDWKRKAESVLLQVSQDASLRPSSEIADDELLTALADVEAACRRAPDEPDALYRARVYEEQAQAVARKADDEFQRIQAAIGPEQGEAERTTSNTPAQQQRIVDALAKARHLIESEDPRGWEPLAGWITLGHDATSGTASVESCAATIGRELADRYAVWHRNRQSRDRLDIRIRAARYLQAMGAFEACPVCEQDLPDTIATELKELASSVAADTDSLRVYVEQGARLIEEAVPAELRGLCPLRPAEQLEAMLRDRLIKHLAGIGNLQQSASESCTTHLQSLPAYVSTAPAAHLACDDWDEQFRNAVGPLQRQYERALQLCAVGQWARDHATGVAEALKPITAGLTEELARLERYGRRFGSLTALSGRLHDAARRCHEAHEDLERARNANRAHGTLREVTKLDSYAKACLGADISGIAGTMREFLDLLYPDNGGIQLASLANRATRKGAKADYRCVLRWSDEEVYADADPIANAGRIRGLLWSYSFGLIERHGPSLAIVALDDPYLSLDDYAAQNMLMDVLVKRLGPDYQILSTVLDRHLVEPVWARDPLQERFGVIRVLCRDSLHRRCRVVEGCEPLQDAIAEYRLDRDRYHAVVERTRIYLERNLKLVAEYVMRDDHSGVGFRALANTLAAAALTGAGATPLGARVRRRLARLLKALGADFGKSPPVIPDGATILNVVHHGGPGESLVTTYEADYVVATYPRWAKAFQGVFDAIDRHIARSRTTAALQADENSVLPRTDPPLTPASFGVPVLEIGRVAAEGLVSVDGGSDEEPREHTWPGVRLALVTTNVCAPVVLPGQLGVFAPSSAVRDGDLALMRTATQVRLRRVFRAPVAQDDEDGWVGQSVNPLVRDVGPIVVRADDVVLEKLVGVLYDRGSEQGLATAPADTDVMAVGTPWPAVLRDVNAGKVYLIRVAGDSAEPVALDGQFLLVRDADPSSIPEGSLCCARLSDGRMMLKRFTSAGNGAYRVLLQPVNAQARYPIVEAVLGASNGSEDGGLDGRLSIEDAQVVCGVLFREPGALEG